jgi:hypothetical protein
MRSNAEGPLELNETVSKATGPDAKKLKKPELGPATVTFTSVKAFVEESNANEPVAVIPPTKSKLERLKVTGAAKAGRNASPRNAKHRAAMLDLEPL